MPKTLLERLRACEILSEEHLGALIDLAEATDPDPTALCRVILERGLLTRYQLQQVAKGRGAELLVGPYLLLDRLGEGGMGQVFKARHRHLERVVALKLIRKEWLASAKAVTNFYQEVRAVARLHHPNIVLAYDAGPAGNTHFFAMEYVHGTDLARLVREKGPLAIVRTCDFAIQVARGLQHAHEKGIIHRDVKPANLIAGIAENGATIVKVLDLGLARLNDHFTKDTSLIPSGTVVGTPDYLAPEQGIDPRRADTRADIYSLGCSLYFLLTGKPPFQAGSLPQLLLKHQMEDPPSVRTRREDVPPALARLLHSMMAKNPNDRPQTFAEVAQLLGAFLSGGIDPTLEMKLSSDDTETFDVSPDRPDSAPKQKERRLFSDTQEIENRSGGWLVTVSVALGLGMLVLATTGVLIALQDRTPEIAIQPDPPPPPPKDSEKEKAPEPVPPPPPIQRMNPRARSLVAAGATTKLNREMVVPGRVMGYFDDGGLYVAEGPFLRCYRPQNGETPWTFTARDKIRGATAIRNVAGKFGYVAASDESKNVFLWRSSAGGGPPLLTFQAKEIIRSLAISSDGKYLAGGGSPTVFLWDLLTGKELSSYTGNRDGEFIEQVAFSADNQLVISGGQTLRVWDTRSGKTTLESIPLGGVMRFLPMNREITIFLLATSQRHLYLLTGNSRTAMQSLDASVFDLAPVPDPQPQVLVCGTGLLGLVDPTTGALTRRFDAAGKEYRWVAVSPSGKYAAVSDPRETVLFQLR
jgi:serine/threonine protein kinase